MNESMSLTLTFNGCLEACKKSEDFVQGKKHLYVFRKESRDILAYIFKTFFERDYNKVTDASPLTIGQLLLKLAKTEDFIVNTLINKEPLIYNSPELVGLEKDGAINVPLLKKYLSLTFNATNKYVKTFSFDQMSLKSDLSNIDLEKLKEEFDPEFVENLQTLPLGEFFLIFGIRNNLDLLEICLRVHTSIYEVKPVKPVRKKK